MDYEGNYKNSAPCINCFEMILSLKIKRMIYSIENDFICCKPSEYSTTHISQGNRFLVNLKTNKLEKKLKK